MGRFPASSILKVPEIKDVNEMDDETLILADIAKKAMSQVHETVVEILMGNDVPEAKAKAIAEALSCGQWTHDYPISAEKAAELGLNVILSFLTRFAT